MVGGPACNIKEDGGFFCKMAWSASVDRYLIGLTWGVWLI
jgi:hypothetical protein